MKNSKKTLLVGWLLTVAVGCGLDLWHAKQFLPPPESRRSGDVLIDVVGEFKTVLARYLWFRMDLFHEVLDDQGVDPEKQKEVLPLLRMVTLLDPSMTDSYDQIVWDIYKGTGDYETAMSLLDEGLEKNPKSYELTFRKALLYYMEKRYSQVSEYAFRGLTLTKDEVQLADCLRLIYWSAKELGDKDTQSKALSDLLKLRPNDELWMREAKKMEAGAVKR